MDLNEHIFPMFRCHKISGTQDRWDDIFSKRPQVTIPKKTVVLQQGQRAEKIYYIINGLFEYSFTMEDGTQGLIEILGDGNIFGLQPILGNNPCPASFIALEDSIVSCISKNEINELLENDPVFCRQIIADFVNITGGLMTQLYLLMFRANQRVEWAIYMLAGQKNRRNPEIKDIFLEVSQEDLARMSRTTRVTVTRSLADLKQRGLLETVYGGVIIYDLEGLGQTLFSNEY